MTYTKRNTTTKTKSDHPDPGKPAIVIMPLSHLMALIEAARKLDSSPTHPSNVIRFLGGRGIAECCASGLLAALVTTGLVSASSGGKPVDFMTDSVDFIRLTKAGSALFNGSQAKIAEQLGAQMQNAHLN